MTRAIPEGGGATVSVRSVDLDRAAVIDVVRAEDAVRVPDRVRDRLAARDEEEGVAEAARRDRVEVVDGARLCPAEVVVVRGVRGSGRVARADPVGAAVAPADEDALPLAGLVRRPRGV